METTETNTFKHKLARFFKRCGVRCTLLGLWLVKNITTILILFCTVLVILMIFGVIPSSDGMYEFWHESGNVANVLSYTIGVIASLASSFLIVFKKAKPLVVSDLSTKEKISMLKNNLYFDKNGLVRKKVEIATGVDVDEDGKIGDGDEKSGILDAASGLITVATVRIDPDHEDQLAEEAQAKKNEEEKAKKIATSTASTDTSTASSETKKNKTPSKISLLFKKVFAKLTHKASQEIKDVKNTLDNSVLPTDDEIAKATVETKSTPTTVAKTNIAEVKVVSSEKTVDPVENKSESELDKEITTPTTTPISTTTTTPKTDEEKITEVANTADAVINNANKVVQTATETVNSTINTAKRAVSATNDVITNKKIDDLLKSIGK